MLLILLLYLAFKHIKFSGGYVTVQTYNDYFEGIIKIGKVTSEELNTNRKLLYCLLKYNSVRQDFDTKDKRQTFNSYKDLIIALYNVKSYISQVYTLKKDTKTFELESLLELYNSLNKPSRRRDKSAERDIKPISSELELNDKTEPKQLDDKIVPKNIETEITNLKTELNDYDVLIVDDKYIFSAYNSVFQFMPSVKIYAPGKFNTKLKKFGPPNIQQISNSIIIPPNAFYNTIRFESNGNVLVDDSSFVGVTCYSMNKKTVENNFDIYKLDTNNVLYSVTSDLHGSFLSLVCWLVQSGRLIYDKNDSDETHGYRFTSNYNNISLICLGDIINYKNAIESPIDGITYNVKLMFDLIDLVFDNRFDAFIRGNHEMMLFHQYKDCFKITNDYSDKLREYVFDLIDVQNNPNMIVKQQTINDIKDYIRDEVIQNIEINSINSLYNNQNYPSTIVTPHLLTKDNKYKKYCFKLRNKEDNKFVYDYCTIRIGKIPEVGKMTIVSRELEINKRSTIDENTPLCLFSHQSLVNMVVDNINTLSKVIPFTYFGWYDFDHKNQKPHVYTYVFKDLCDNASKGVYNRDIVHKANFDKNNVRGSCKTVLNQYQYSNNKITSIKTKLIEYYTGFYLRAFYNRYTEYDNKLSEENTTFFKLDVLQLLKLYSIPTDLFNKNIDTTVSNIIKTRDDIAKWFCDKFGQDDYSLLCNLANLTNNLEQSLKCKIVNIHGHIGSLFSFAKSSKNTAYNGQTFDIAYNNYIDEADKMLFKRNLYNSEWSTFNDYSINPDEYRTVQTNFLNETNLTQYLPLSIDSSFVFNSDNNILATYYGYTTKLHSIYPILTIDTGGNIYEFKIFKCFNKTNDFGERKMLLFKWLNILGRVNRMENKTTYNDIYKLINNYHYIENNNTATQVNLTNIIQKLKNYQNTINPVGVVRIEINKIKHILCPTEVNNNVVAEVNTTNNQTNNTIGPIVDVTNLQEITNNSNKPVEQNEMEIEDNTNESTVNQITNNNTNDTTTNEITDIEVVLQ